MNIVCGWQVANSILIKSFEDKIYITPLKLDCLIYLLYSEYLYLTGEKLFSETFMKTSYGSPKLTSIYEKFGVYGNNVIRSYAFDARGKITYVGNETFDKCLMYVWEEYKNIPTVEVLSYLNDGKQYSRRKPGFVIDELDSLNDIITKKENELEVAKSNVKKLILQREQEDKQRNIKKKN